MPLNRFGRRAANPKPLVKLNGRLVVNGIRQHKDIRWESSHLIIERSFWKLMKKKGRAPYYHEIAADVGMSYPTVSTHVRQMTFEKTRNRLRIMQDGVVESMGRAATFDADSSAARLYLQFMGWSEKTEVEHSLKPPQAIDINGKEITF